MVVMDRIRIKCPFCGAILETLDNPANYEKNIVCPNCKTKNKFKDFKRVITRPVSSQEDDTTHFETKTKDTVGCLVDLLTQRKYLLKEGKNLIGRLTVKTPPLADIPIATQDMGMSRKHLFIDVIKGRDGRFHAYAYNASNKNATLINGVVLEDDDKIGLKHDDILTLCETKIRYVGGSIDDETDLTVPDDETEI